MVGYSFFDFEALTSNAFLIDLYDIISLLNKKEIA
ncbi:Uncharacterised protein [Staphylococcus microti]|uniref:Uncharacterized protein n=1 Tax=Staphylococcus microti TaxID=569857 RepID=A0A380GT45_9STAP|nr:Uncharacterised protein [Staphylococcus microti]